MRALLLVSCVMRIGRSQVQLFDEAGLTWSEAQAKCSEKGLALASYYGSDSEKDDFLIEIANKGLAKTRWKFWIGAFDDDFDGVFRWDADNSLVNLVALGFDSTELVYGSLTIRGKDGYVGDRDPDDTSRIQGYFCGDASPSGPIPTPEPTAPTSEPTRPTLQPTEDPIADQPHTPSPTPETPSPTPEPADGNEYTDFGVCSAGITDAEQYVKPLSVCERVRPCWNDMSTAERAVYIEGFRQLTVSGIAQDLQRIHREWGYHYQHQFLSWHRHFLYMLEEEIRALGDQTANGGYDFTCFGLPYWNSVDELASDPVILSSGLGGDGSGFADCVYDGPFQAGQYAPASVSWASSSCLRRDYDAGCAYVSAATVMDVITNADGDDDGQSSFEDYWGAIEYNPHARPHICMNGHMIQMDSPADPIFYLHHAFVDYWWALWQDAHDYDGHTYSSYTDAYVDDINACMEFAVDDDDDEGASIKTYPKVAVKDTLDLYGNYNVRYEKGTFWNLANVEDQNWNINGSWFTDVAVAVRRRMRGRDPSFGPSFGFGAGNGAKRRQRTARESDAMSAAIYKNASRKAGKNGKFKAVRRWAIELCEYEEQMRNETCEVPEEGYDDCSDAPIDEETGDVAYTLDEMLAKNGNTDCMRETISKAYNYAKARGQLKSLCAGCYDPFCDRSFLRGKCGSRGRDKDTKLSSAQAVFLPGVSGGESGGKTGGKMYGDAMLKYIKSHFSSQLALVLALVVSALCNVMCALHCVCSSCNGKKQAYEKLVVEDL